MDLIKDYSSDDSEETKEEDREEGQLIPVIAPLNIYLQNYSAHHNMSSIFLYIPWNPPLRVVSQLKSISNNIVNELRKNLPSEVSDKYNWRLIGVPSKTAEGSFSITNNFMLRNYHISLCPNIRGDQDKIQKYIENFQYTVSRMKVPGELVTPDHSEAERIQNINRILFKETEKTASKQKNYISLRLGNSLLLFRSNSSNNLFVTGKIRMDPSSRRFFDSMETAITDNVNLLDVTKEGSTDQKQTYHISLIVGEFKGLRPKRNEIEQIKKIIENMNISKQLSEIPINVDQIKISELSVKHLSHDIRFRI